ncbi:MAG: tetratricopeptide repeat protein [Planctomycetaceae bacterium]
MRKSISCILLLGAMGCGQSDTAPTTSQSAPQPAVGPTSVATAPVGLSPEQCLKRAQEFIDKQELKAAIQTLNQTLQTYPDLAEAYTLRATLLADAKLYVQAIRDMDKAIRLKPDEATYYNTRGYFSLLMENNGPAMDDFNQAIALDLNYAQPLNNRGLVFISLGGQFKQAGEVVKASGEFRKAVLEFDSAIRIDSKYVDAHNNRGFALTLDRKYDEAIQSFTRAIELNSQYVNAWNNRGQAYAQTGQHELAIADFTKAIELQPNTLEYYQLRADAYLAAGKSDLARKDLDHVEWCYELDAVNRRLASSPKTPMNWVERGHLLRKVARWEEAIKNYEDALKLDPKCQPALVGIAYVQFKQGQLDQSLATCQTILNAGPNRDAASIRGDILNQQGKYDEAIADYEAAQRFDSKVAQAYLKRAELRKAQGDIQQASADIVQAIEMDPSLRNSVPDAPQLQTAEQVKPGAFPVDEVEATPIEQTATPTAEVTAPTQTAEKPAEPAPAAAATPTTPEQPAPATPAEPQPPAPAEPTSPAPTTTP